MGERIRFEVAPYDRAKHEGFVCASWCRGARESWWELSRYLRRPETTCRVAHVPGDPDSLLGWVALDASGAVIWLYVRDLYGKVRRRGLGGGLLSAVGIDPTERTPCLYWSPKASDIAATSSWRIYFQPRRAAA